MQIPNGKAILVTNGNDTINNFSFSGAFVAPSDANGEGIRYQAGNLVLNNDYFFNNQEGMLAAASATGTITINYCEFDNNGVSDPKSAGYGYTHNLYVGDIVPNGGNAVIKNNVIEQGPLSDNVMIIAFGEEGSIHAGSGLQVSGNQILNDMSSSSALAVWNKVITTTAQITGNQFFGLSSSQIVSGPATQSSNVFLATEPALIAAHPWSY